MWKYKATYGIVYSAVCIDYLWMNQQIPFILLIFLTILPIFLKIVITWIARSVQISCILREACVVNQNLGIQLQVTCKSRLPIGRIGLKSEYYNVMFRETNLQRVFLEAGDTKQLFYELPFVSDHCGKIKLKVSDLVVYDVLGLTSAAIGNTEDFEFTIYPEVKELQIVQERQPITREYGFAYDKNHKGQDVSEVFDIREYVAGDIPKSIHWKLSTKYDDLMVRDFSKPVNYNTLVMFNLGFSREGISVSNQLLNHVISMAVSLSFGMMMQGIPHHVGYLEKSVLLHEKVDSKESYQTMLDLLMSMAIPDAAEDTMPLIDHLQSQQFTKLIYVADSYNEGVAAAISAFSDLTVILIRDEKLDIVEDFHTYDVIRISPDTLHDAVQIITI